MIVRHPRFPDMARDVPAEDVDRWTAAGWLPVEEKNDDDTNRKSNRGRHRIRASERKHDGS